MVWEQDVPLNTNSISNILLLKLNLFLNTVVLIKVPHSQVSDKLDFLEGDQKPAARSTKEGAKGQQMGRRGECCIPVL